MSKVKFDASTEYSYEANLKILQSTYDSSRQRGGSGHTDVVSQKPVL